ncbi:MAG: CpaF family protein [Pseudobdellovibrionaceae bacterium]
MANIRHGAQIYKDAIEQNMAPILPYLNDATVSEVLINGPDEIFVERKGKLEKVPARFASESALQAAVTSIAGSVERRVSEEEPRLDARMPDGSRLAVVMPPCSRKGTTVSIRKFTKNKISLVEYIKTGALNEDGALFLNMCMYLGKNVIVSGGNGSGKTTLLNLLCSKIPKGQRIIVIEDSSELQIEYEHVVMFETKHASASGEGEISIRDLVKSSLRLRPDRIIVGEVRSAEALELINAMNTGHKGCLGTVHANSAQDAIVRLEALAQGGDSRISERALRLQISSAVEIIVQISRLSDGSRKVTEISEVRGFSSDGNYLVVPIYRMSRLKRQADGTLLGQLESTGEVPSFMQEIIDNNFGGQFPISKFAVPKSA